MMGFELARRAEPSRLMKFLAPLQAIVLTLLVGLAIFATLGQDPVGLLHHRGALGRLLAVGQEQGEPIATFVLSLSPLRRIMKDYFIVCDTYYKAIRTAPPSRIQAIDMGRRALHDDGSKLLIERLKGKITVDHDTARRLFTLICALHWKG